MNLTFPDLLNLGKFLVGLLRIVIFGSGQILKFNVYVRACNVNVGLVKLGNLPISGILLNPLTA